MILNMHDVIIYLQEMSHDFMCPPVYTSDIIILISTNNVTAKSKNNIFAYADVII